MTYDDVAGSSTYAYDEYATGTTDSPDTFIAGEEGPELIVGKPNSTVFPNDETDRIIQAVSEHSFSYDFSRTINSPDNFYVPVGDYDTRSTESASVSSREKKITLEIAGKGNIELSGGKPDKESMIAFLYEYMKPVLSEILSQEIYEEGDLSYDY